MTSESIEVSEDVLRKAVREAFTMPTKLLVLVLLAVRGEMHGYEILKELENLSGGLWRPSHSYVYNVLSKMVEEGLLEAREEYRGKVRRVKYVVTEKGFQYLAAINDLVLDMLYRVVQYHEILRDKLRELKIRKPAREILEEHAKMIRDIIDRLSRYLEKVEKELEKL